MGGVRTAQTASTLEPRPRHAQPGFTLVEVLFATALIGILMVGLAGVVTNTLAVRDDTRERNALAREARFAMERMVGAVGATRLLLVPMVEDPGTAPSESVIDPGVLAVTLDPNLDRDLDGIADADNDGDGNRFTGGDDGLLWIRVELENTELALETLTAR